MNQKHEWYVLTGAPCSGKSTVLAVLRARGFRIVEEVARTYIDQQLSLGQTLAEIRKDEKAFQEAVLELKFQVESHMTHEEEERQQHQQLQQQQQQQHQQPHPVVFFERGIPDSVAYARANGFELHSPLLDTYSHIQSNYKKVFLLERLPYVLDYARVEDTVMQEKLQNELVRVYEEMSHEVPLVVVPVMGVEERVAFILSHVTGSQN